MIVGFLGDVHGHVFHALGVLLRWQQENDRSFDLVVQVGDLGVWPDLARLDRATRRFAQTDPGELDFSRLLHLSDHEAALLADVRQHLGCPVWFIRGNHEDDLWLRQRAATELPPIAVDPVGLYQYIPDGRMLEVQGYRCAFAGGTDISDEAYRRLADLDVKLDLLVTHNAPWGLSKGWRGDVQGSERLRALLEVLQPRYHLFGHLHHMIGPVRVGDTVCIGLDQLVAPVRDEPSQAICPGGLGVLDTSNDRFCFVQEDWLAEFGREMGVFELCSRG